MGFLRHPEYLAILAAVLADPADDAPRLVAADWLDERPENAARLYADFVRVQCELARREGARRSLHASCGGLDGLRALDSSDPRRQEDARLCRIMTPFRERERELFGADDGRTLAWFGLPRPWARIARLGPFDAEPLDYPYAVIRRGFVGAATLPTQAFLDNAAAVFAAAPLTLVTLADRQLLVNRRWYCWERSEEVDAWPWRVPAVLWDLVAGQPGCRVRGRRAGFASGDLALAGLSASCVACGRAAAHLSPLPVMTTASR